MDEERAISDRRLAERIDAGDASVLEAVYDAHAGAVYRQALALLGCSADAEDVMQEVFLKLVSRRGGPVRDLRAYLLTAARHEATSVLRRRRRHVRMEEAATVAVPEHSVDARYDPEAVRAALAGLPAPQREVVMLKIYEQLTFAEIGGRVRASLNTVASRYRYGLAKLRQALGDSIDVP